MARKWMYDRIMAVPLATSTFGSRVMATGAVEGPAGDGDSPARPFAVIRKSTDQRPLFLNMSKVKQTRFQVYVHDTPGDTDNIDSLCAQLEERVPMNDGQVTAEGRFIECRWEDTSGDGYDDHYGTTVRYVTFLVTWKPAVQP